MPEDSEAMMSQIDKAVREHLPEKVGKLLRERLDQLDALEKKCKDQAKQLEGLDERIALANKIIHREEAVKRREDNIDAVEADLAEKQWAVAIKEAVCEERKKAYGDMKEITLAVFANSRFKYAYSEDGSVPVRGSNGYLSQEGTSRNGTVEGEGRAPGSPCP